MPKLKTPVPKVFSYIRFSTPEQRLGDSERRQLDAAKAYAKRKQLNFDDSPMMDEGRSAYHGTHRKKGHLGRFIGLIETGKVPPGSILIVENIDRLSREDFLQAFETVSRIITNDVTIVTLTPEAEYNCESLKGGMIYQLVGQMQMAHEESSKKAERGKENWKQKRRLARNQGLILTCRRPAWLDIVTKDGCVLSGGNLNSRVDHSEIEFALNPNAAAAIRMAFEHKLNGLGMRTSAIKLNAEAPWKPKNGWRDSYIKKTLLNRAVIGEYQPHVIVDGGRVPDSDPIQGYYPPIVEPEVFFAVQQQMEQNKGKGGRKDRASNLFTHLVKCAYCGGSMRFVNKGKPPKGQMYLECDNGYRGHGCARHRVRYDECETSVLDNCHQLRPEQVLPDADEQAQRCAALRQRIAGSEAELADITQRIENYIDQIGRTESATMRDQYEACIVKLGQDTADKAKIIERDKRDLQTVEKSTTSLRTWTNKLAELRAEITQDEAVELRLRLGAHLRELIERIEVFAVGYGGPVADDTADSTVPQRSRETDDGRLRCVPPPRATTDDFVEHMEAITDDYFPQEWQERTWRPFIEHLADLRLTKRGRFFRVHFKTGAVLDFVPEGSLASGVELVLDERRRPGWRFVSPKIDRLYRDFKTEHRKREQAAEAGKLVTTC